MSYQNYPDTAGEDTVTEGNVEDTQSSQVSSTEQDGDEILPVGGCYTLPPVPVPVRRPPTEKTQLLMQTTSSSGQSNGENSQENGASTSAKTGERTDEFSKKLSHLATMDHVFIKEQIEITDSVIGLGLKTNLKVVDSHGHRLLSGHLDKTGCCTTGPLDMIIKDGHDQPIIHLTTLCSTPTCCFPTCGLCCSPMSVEMMWEGGKSIGRIEETRSFWSVWGSSRKIRVLNVSNELLFTVLGPNASCFQKGEFKIVAQTDEGKTLELGKICNKWTNETIAKNKDMLGVSFPKELDTVSKTMLISICMILDLTYFSSS